MARPPKPKYNIKSMVKKIKEYTDSAKVPILKECCLENEWNYDYIMELQRKHSLLSQSIRRLLMKKEVQLEKALYSGSNNTGCVFGLKQLGWKDNPDPIIINNEITNNVTGNRSKKLNECSVETLLELERLYDEVEAQCES